MEKTQGSERDSMYSVWARILERLMQAYCGEKSPRFKAEIVYIQSAIAKICNLKPGDLAPRDAAS